MNDVTITINGTDVTITQDEIVSPKYECSGCFTPAEYVARIAEYGITTITNNGDGSFTYKKYSPHCICEISFTEEC